LLGTFLVGDETYIVAEKAMLVVNPVTKTITIRRYGADGHFHRVLWSWLALAARQVKNSVSPPLFLVFEKNCLPSAKKKR